MGLIVRTTMTRVVFGGLIALAVVALALGTPARAADIERIHFLIPGGAGGGWDGTARGTGEALTKSGLVGQASYENMSGGGGGKAIAHIIETAERQHGTMMVNSTPIVLRSLRGRFPQSFRDLTPIAAEPEHDEPGAATATHDHAHTHLDGSSLAMALWAVAALGALGVAALAMRMLRGRSRSGPGAR